MVDRRDPALGTDVLGPIGLTLQALDLDNEVVVGWSPGGVPQRDNEVRDEVVLPTLVLVGDREVEPCVLHPPMHAW